MLVVQVGALTFTAAEVGDYLITPDGFDGWWGRPAGSMDTDKRPGSHGEFDARPFLPGRVVSISGAVLANDAARVHACSALSGLGADGDRLRLVVSEHGDSSWAWCRVLQVQVDRKTSIHYPEYQVTLRCADPRKFGEAREFVSPRAYVDAFHYGNHPATPRFVVSGPFTGGYRLRTASSVFEVPSTLASGSVDEVDFDTGLVRRNGVPLVNVGGIRQRFTVPGGGEVSWRVEAVTSGTGSAVMTLPDTYV